MTADIISFNFSQCRKTAPPCSRPPDAVARAQISAAAGHLDRAADCLTHGLRLAEACSDLAISPQIARHASALLLALAEQRDSLAAMAGDGA